MKEINNDDLKKKIDNIPLNPGIYLMKNIDKQIIYVGKAKALGKRVKQYFNKSPKTIRIQKMVSQITDIEYIITNNELEALVLECNYIKENMPKYNVMLKDDKNYPYIKITVKETYPRIFITRKKLNDNNLYFGPYTDVKAANDVMHIIKEIFPVKRCKISFEKPSNKKKGPCLYYHIGRCVGPCINDVILDEYKKMIEQIKLFINGDSKGTKQIITNQINEAIEKLDFERAAKLKSRLESIDKLSVKQQVDNINENSTDIWGYVLEDVRLHLQVFKIRNSKIIKHTSLKLNDLEEGDITVSVLSIMSQYYSEEEVDIPKKIYASIEDSQEEISVLEEYLSSKKKQKVEIRVPKIGDKKKLVEMVENNLKVKLLQSKEENVINILKDKLNFEKELNIIEAYDISNLKNEYIVGAMIRWEHGKLNKKMYRKFKIRSTNIQNDPLCMAEVILRRLKHLDDWGMP
ncbi:MAG: excinuclease ABC subunit UvrC, partial [Clostridia bacterium]|nr:excinuclease ABC subunit UvrC [Clostridia bacterium]